MTSRDLERYCEAVRSAILATARLLVLTYVHPSVFYTAISETLSALRSVPFTRSIHMLSVGNEFLSSHLPICITSGVGDIIEIIEPRHYYPRDAMLIVIATCLFICLSVTRRYCENEES